MTTATTTSTPPTRFYAPTNPDCPETREAARMRREEFAFWEKHLPEPSLDIDLVLRRLQAITGKDLTEINSYISALYRLRELPKLAALQAKYFLLDFNRLIGIDKALDRLGVAPQFLYDQVDQALIDYLTPRRANQHLPTRANIVRRVREIITALDDTIAMRKGHKKRRFRSDSEFISLEVEEETRAIIDRQVREMAKELDVPLADAAVALLTGAVKPTAHVILHTYRATDVEFAPTFIEGYGTTLENLTPTVVRDESQVEESCSYKTPDVMAKFIEGRDGTCRFPGCKRPAHKCQKDHCVDFSDGGPTHPSNLFSFCQHHHNMKTDGRFYYIPHLETGDLVFLFEDGTWEITEPSGPLSPKQKHWVQSVSQNIQARRRSSHAEAQALKIELDGQIVEIYEAPQPDPDEPAPF